MMVKIKHLVKGIKNVKFSKGEIRMPNCTMGNKNSTAANRNIMHLKKQTEIKCQFATNENTIN